VCDVHVLGTYYSTSMGTILDRVLLHILSIECVLLFSNFNLCLQCKFLSERTIDVYYVLMCIKF